MPEQTEWGIELPATPANGEYREPMGEARKAGLEARNATRLERAQQRAEEGCQGNQRGSGKACDCDACGPSPSMTFGNVKAAIRSGLGGDTEEGCACESHICSAADAVLALSPTVADTKALAETATEMGRRLGHAEAADIADALAAGVVNPEKLYNEAFIHACGVVARAIRDAS